MTQLEAGLELAGRFRLQRPLGRGGSAEVWAATDNTTGTEVALRLLAARDEAELAALLAGLEADAARLRRLVHPGILRPLAVVAAGDRACVAVELADAGDLGALRGAGWQPIVAALREVVDALQYVHAQGHVHGDLKAGNVLRDRQGRWRLTDFRSGALPEANSPVSLSNASPQQLDGATATVADDVYALGALLYDLLAGGPPLHPGITPERIRAEVPERLGVDGQGAPIPLALTQLVAAMLEKSPRLRPGNLGAVRRAARGHRQLRSCARQPGSGNGPAAPRSRCAARRAAGPASRSRALVAGVFVLLVAGVLAVVFWLPRVVTERGPLVKAAPRTSVTTPAVPAAAAPTVPDPRLAADAALAARGRAEDAARAAAADRWGGADWLEARRLAAVGDGQYRDRDFLAAAASFGDGDDPLPAPCRWGAGGFRRRAQGGPGGLRAGRPAGGHRGLRAGAAHPTWRPGGGPGPGPEPEAG